MATNSFENFLNMVEDAEVKETEVAKVAPFDLKSKTEKIIFMKCRAKNFKSIGNDFMEIDFVRNKTTLIVSEDNGSGKSTMCVWAPYFALFGKPYNNKEKIGALVNSANRKEMLVELEFNTKGESYMIRRGYKPSLFELYVMVGNDWVKLESEAALKDQQKFLDDLIGFDAKIAENVMILGSEKFVPFVEMDAPSRRHVVETIWDLAVFPVMLKIAKEEQAVNQRKFSETSIAIDQTQEKLRTLQLVESEINTTSELLETTKAQLNSDQELFERRRLEYTEYKETNTKDINELNQKLEAERTRLDSIVKEIDIEFCPRISEIERKISGLGSEKANDLDIINQKFRDDSKPISDREQSLNERKQNEENAIYESSKVLLSKICEKRDAKRAELELSHQSSLDSFIPAILDELRLIELKEELSVTETKHAGRIEYATTLHNETNNQIQLLHTAQAERSKTEFELKHISSELEALGREVEEFSHLGVCPTCRQTIGEKAISLLNESLSERRNTLTEKFNGIKKNLSDRIEICENISKEIDTLRAEIVEVDKSIEITKSSIAEYYLEISQIERTNEEFNRKQKEKITERFKENLAELELWYSQETMKIENKRDLSLAAVRNKYETEELEILNSKSELVSTHNRNCQEIDEKYDYRLRELSKELEVTKNNRDHQIQIKSAETNKEIEVLSARIRSLTSKFEEYHISASEEILRLGKSIKSMKEMVATNQSKIDQKRATLDSDRQELETNQTSLTHDIEAIGERAEAYKYVINELGDKAAKADIIKAYLPYLNSKINEYLAALNLFVGFKIDENFEVEFTSPDRKGQTTFSLSKGQLTRMNLSVLFALRDVANLKASISSNLLILDETIEPLSAQGVREVMEMMNTKFNHTNIFVISQRETEFSEYFKNTVKYGLRGGFTEIV